MRYCFLSLDVEEDLVHGQTVPEFRGIEVLPVLHDIFEKHKVSTTFFCTGEVIRQYAEILQEFKRNGHEMGLHGYYRHVNMLDQSQNEREEGLDQHMSLYSQTFGTPPKGFRAVQNTIDEAGMKLLEEKGLGYDSSLISRYPIGKKYVGYTKRAPRQVYHPSHNDVHKKGTMEIVEVPLSPLIGGIQLQGRWIQKLGTAAIKNLIHMYTPSLLSFSFHSWDLLSSHTEKTHNRLFLRELDELIGFLKKKGYTFLRGDELYTLL